MKKLLVGLILFLLAVPFGFASAQDSCKMAKVDHWETTTATQKDASGKNVTFAAKFPVFDLAGEKGDEIHCRCYCSRVCDDGFCWAQCVEHCRK